MFTNHFSYAVAKVGIKTNVKYPDDCKNKNSEKTILTSFHRCGMHDTRWPLQFSVLTRFHVFDIVFLLRLHIPPTSGVGKLRPAGQIGTAEAFCSARGVAFWAQAIYNSCKNETFCCCLFRSVAQRAKNFLKRPADKKNCAPPLLF